MKDCQAGAIYNSGQEGLTVKKAVGKTLKIRKQAKEMSGGITP